jgi:hypothetical protein
MGGALDHSMHRRKVTPRASDTRGVFIPMDNPQVSALEMGKQSSEGRSVSMRTLAQRPISSSGLWDLHPYAQVGSLSCCCYIKTAIPIEQAAGIEPSDFGLANRRVTTTLHLLGRGTDGNRTRLDLIDSEVTSPDVSRARIAARTRRESCRVRTAGKSEHHRLLEHRLPSRAAILALWPPLRPGRPTSWSRTKTSWASTRRAHRIHQSRKDRSSDGRRLCRIFFFKEE